MTKQEWDSCADPQRMLAFLRGRASDRKLRLFAAACCRRVWPLLADERSRRAVEVGERYADGQAGEIEREASWSEARAAISERPPLQAKTSGTKVRREARVLRAAASAACFTVCLPQSAGQVAQQTAFVARERGLAWSRGTGDWQCDLLHCVFGNPFPPPPRIDPTWLFWDSRTVPKLAASAYEERQLPSGHLDPYRLAVLADALEEAGCADEALLSHLRDSGVHTRGCWAVDLLLGKA